MQNYRSIKVNKGVINRLMLYCMIVWYLLPLDTFKMGTLPVVCMFLIWCVTCNIGRLLNSVSILAPFFVWYLYGLAIYAFGSFYGVEPLYYFTMTLLFAIPSVMYHYYKTENNWKLFKNIRWLTYIVLLIAAINTIRVLITYPMAAKILAMSGIQSEGKEYYIALGCGGYNYVYSIVISFTAILFSRKPTTIWSTLLKVSVLVGSAIAVILSQYTLALLLIRAC